MSTTAGGSGGSRASRSQLAARARELADGASQGSGGSGERRRRQKRRRKRGGGGGGGRLTAQQRGRRTYKFPMTQEKLDLRREVMTLGDGWGFYDMIHFKKEWTRLGMWEWTSEIDTKMKAIEAQKQAELDATEIDRAKARYESVQARQRALKEQRCQWNGFDHKGRRAVCTNNRIIHEKTRQLTQYCGFHVQVCVHKWPTNNHCVAYEEEHKNGFGLCMNHYKARFQGTEPPHLHKIPGVVSNKAFKKLWAKKLARAMRMPHPLAPEPESSDDSDYSSDDSDSSEDEKTAMKRRQKEAEERLKKLQKQILKEQGLASDSDDDDEEGKSLQQLWYTKVKQPIIERLRGKRSAIRLQAWYRRLRAKWYVRKLRRIVWRGERERAVRVIQNGWRGHLDRVYVRRYRKQVHIAAARIQRGWYAHLFWGTIRQQLAVKKLSGWWKRQKVKRFMKMLGVIAKARIRRQRRLELWRDTLERLNRETSRMRGVIGMQKLWRAYSVRKLYTLQWKVYRRSANQIGMWWKGALARTEARNNMREAIGAATSIQKNIRRKLAIKHVADMRVEYRIAATNIQRWWRGEVARERVRGILMRLERNWRWFNPGAPRDDFLGFLPRSRYGLAPLEQVTRLTQVRRGTMFQKMGPYIPLDEALRMQHLAEGMRQGAKVVEVHEGVLAEEVVESPTAAAGATGGGSGGEGRRRERLSNVKPVSKWGNDSVALLAAAAGSVTGKSRKKRLQGKRRGAPTGRSKRTVLPPTFAKDELKDEGVLDRAAATRLRAAAMRSATGQRPTSVSRGTPVRRSRSEASLVPTNAHLLDIFSAVKHRKTRYYDANYRKTAPVFKEVERQRDASAVARLWNRPGMRPAHPGRVVDPVVHEEDAEELGGVTLADHLEWEEDLIKSLEQMKRDDQVAATGLPADHRLRRPGVTTPDLLKSRRAFAQVRQERHKLVRESKAERDRGVTSFPTTSDNFMTAVSMVSQGALMPGTSDEVRRRAAIAAQYRRRAEWAAAYTEGEDGGGGRGGKPLAPLPAATRIRATTGVGVSAATAAAESADASSEPWWHGRDPDAQASASKPRAPWMRASNATLSRSTLESRGTFQPRSGRAGPLNLSPLPSPPKAVIAVTGNRFSVDAPPNPEFVAQLASRGSPSWMDQFHL